ncbi:MAG: hypothetical protein VYE73_09910, partial [Acidobacteriota bacterium]|nr:hypothetical protein [Acidobacteriota bacterium]
AWKRVAAVYREVEGYLAVVTHGLVCHSLALNHLAIDPPLEPPERWGNTSLTEIEPGPPWRVATLNCIAHLNGEVADDTSSRSGF